MEVVVEVVEALFRACKAIGRTHLNESETRWTENVKNAHFPARSD